MYSDVMNNCEVVTCDTPVLLCVFNRPDLTKMAIDNLRAVKPKRLYVSADGPRAEVTSDELNCKLVREQIENVDWQLFLYLDVSCVGMGDLAPSMELL